jgi:glycosyltransferase involved in cell wall biosynthesis
MPAVQDSGSEDVDRSDDLPVSDKTAGRARIRHLTSAHGFDDTRILHKQCKSLAADGYDVALIVGGDYTGTFEGVRILGVGGPRNRLDRMLRVAWAVYRAARRERADICHLHDPELLWVGFLLKARGHKVIYDVHEDVPKQIMNKFWIPRRVRWLLSTAAMLVERAAAKVFDGLVTATPFIAERFPAPKTAVVQNFPESAIARRAPAEGTPTAWQDRRHAFVYAGGLAAVQGIREIVATAGLLPADAKAVIAGWFDDDALEREVRSSPGWRRVNFLGQVGRPEVVAAIDSAQSGIILDHPISNYLDAHSTKMFEYMACGLPVVCSDFPLWVRMVGEADCGVVVDPLDPRAAADVIQRLMKDPEEAQRLGENGRRAVLEKYNWETEIAKLEDLYARIA